MLKNLAIFAKLLIKFSDFQGKFYLLVLKMKAKDNFVEGDLNNISFDALDKSILELSFNIQSEKCARKKVELTSYI